MFLDNTQINIEFVCVLSKNIGTTEPITFTYGLIRSLHSWESSQVSSVQYNHTICLKNNELTSQHFGKYDRQYFLDIL